MGRDWYWGGRSTKRARGGGEERDTSSGCMSAVFQFFDFHQFQICLHQQQPSFNPHSFLHEDPTILKGVEAPRNSLESEEAIMVAAASLSSVMNEEENLNIPMGIQIKTSGGDTRPKVVLASNDLSSESSYSPGTKTPNLVARLMGLDLLPENYSPSSSSSSHGTQKNPIAKSHLQHKKSSSRRYCLDNDISGTQSLPETPRVSSARRSTDVDHRLSLQINKENISLSEELELSRYSSSTMAKWKEHRVHNDENRSPSQYARQIVKQVKETVSRKAGLDITNTMKNREQRRDLHVMAIKSKKYSKVFTKVGDELSPGKHSTTPSCSPRVRFLEPKNKPTVTTSSTRDQTSHSPKLLSSLFSSSSASQPLQEQQQKSIKRCKRVAGERFGSRTKKPPQTSDTIRNKQEEPFVRPSSATTRAKISDKKCKKTPLSNGLLNIIAVPTLVPVKKDPSPPATKLPQKQSQVPHAQASKRITQLSSCPSQTYKQQATHSLPARDNNDDNNISDGATTFFGGGVELQYVTRILKRTGIDRDTPVSFTRWFSPSHPLDPSIFHHLEHSFPTTATAAATTGDAFGQLRHRCNRKLIFHLADEILVEILKPYINMKPWICLPSIHHDHQMKGSQLIENLCRKIRSFPSANCQVLQDIDALIDKDLQEEPPKYQTSMAFEEEGEAIVLDLEKEIMDSLVHETAVLCELWCGISVQKRL